ncbi:hypothetical protein L5515_003093 [Caenorhabditis briggsae]|uniref:C2H2-type domain-containing protein n=1 Tax=Caenorhabditis briggsae TaxID=6238 RepID=A0AAE9EHC3_CAEBR|nr:hypothetical protein L5515_003093 [Caenorhabditis briggsae]
MSSSDSEEEWETSRRRGGKNQSEKMKKPTKSSKMHKSRSRSPITRRESPKSQESRSSSRGTFDGIDDPSPPSAVLRRSSSPPYFSCGQCRRTFDTVREISEHEIRDHESQIVCFHCEKKSITVDHLASHTKHRHPPKPVMCAYCQEPFGKSAELMTNSDWKQFRDHIEREAIRKRMYRYGTTPDTTSGQALRGVGACPHGPPVKCRNFPQCPGYKCIYSHNLCRYASTCNKTTCPFDHPDRPRTCMNCISDMRIRRN